MPVKVCAVTSTRADYGILSPLLKRMRDDSAFELTVAATGTHLLEEFGHTVDEIIRDHFSPIQLPIMAHSPIDSVEVSGIMGQALRRFAAFFSAHHFDLLLVLGDRYEIAAICAAAVNARLPIAHLHGGETTEGAIDECYRHSITKMSLLHFASCDVYRRRIIQLGEQPDRVFNVGALGAENILRTPDYPLGKLGEEVGLPLREGGYALVTFHPTTQESGTALGQLRELMAAMDEKSDLDYLITKSNADEDGERINRAWEKYAQARKNCRVVASLGMRRYITAMRYCRMMIGNSSSGIIEGPVCRIPTVNIGDRQKGRLLVPSIVNCPPVRDAILRAMREAERPEMRDMLRKQACPYGDGTTSEQIVSILKEKLCEPLELKKVFYDIKQENKEG